LTGASRRTSQLLLQAARQFQALAQNVVDFLFGRVWKLAANAIQRDTSRVVKQARSRQESLLVRHVPGRANLVAQQLVDQLS